LLLRQPELATITFVNPQINVVAHRSQKWIDQAQDKALASDRNMTQELGSGLTGLTLGKISIQNGIFTFIDRARLTEGTLIVDHIHLGLHALSPNRASPLTATARIHNIPFVVNGQVGPLPDSLDPLEMPLLLSLDAKSSGLADFNDMFPDSHVQARLSRGYLTTMLHGTLNSGLETSSWIQLDGLELVNTDKLVANEKKFFWNFGVARAIKEGPRFMDVAFRQKSKLILNRDHKSTLAFEECFVYLNGTPIIEMQGNVIGGLSGILDFEFNFLDSVSFQRLPGSQFFPLGGGTPTGKIFVKGSWPEGVEIRSQLDLSPTTIHLPPFVKNEAVPLSMTATAQFSNERFHIQNSRFSNPGDATSAMEFSGLILPTLALQGIGRWPLAQLADYFPIIAPWSPFGEMDLEMVMTTAKNDMQPDRASGILRVKGGRINNFSFEKLEVPFRWIDPELRLSHVLVDMGDGRLDGFFTVVSNEGSPWFYSAMINPTGIAMDKLPTAWIESEARLEGLVFGSLNFQGTLNNFFIPEPDTMTGHGYLFIQPGRLGGIDPITLFKPPTEKTTISSSEQWLYWDRAQAGLRWNRQGVQLEKFQIQGVDFLMKGQGQWNFKDKHWFDLQVFNDSSQEGGDGFLVHVEGDDITKGLRMMPLLKAPP
ncbi:MAG TPA: DUF748 domain-containing protein, partial [Magnetococcales bacterium]|nr:DUF748 domain-containing protein [Magnetococcales bacterium]